MKIHIAAIGKLKDASFLQMIERYCRQSNFHISITELEAKPTSLPESKKTEKEGELLLKSIPEGFYIIALDERGQLLNSIEFAHIIETKRDESRGIAFLIGGASGHARPVIQKADKLLSLGKMTWPHMLARVMLSEQIYRASTLLSGHPYHK